MLPTELQWMTGSGRGRHVDRMAGTPHADDARPASVTVWRSSSHSGIRNSGTRKTSHGTAGSRPVRGQEPADPMCVHWGLARGTRRPPRTPWPPPRRQAAPPSAAAPATPAAPPSAGRRRGWAPIRPFGDHSGLSVEAFDNATGELPPGSEPVQNQVAVRAQPCGQPPSSGRSRERIVRVHQRSRNWPAQYGDT